MRGLLAGVVLLSVFASCLGECHLTGNDAAWILSDVTGHYCIHLSNSPHQIVFDEFQTES